MYTIITQQTQNIFITFIQRRPNISDVGPTLYKCYTNVCWYKPRNQRYVNLILLYVLILIVLYKYLSTCNMPFISVCPVTTVTI